MFVNIWHSFIYLNSITTVFERKKILAGDSQHTIKVSASYKTKGERLNASIILPSTVYSLRFACTNGSLLVQCSYVAQIM